MKKLLLIPIFALMLCFIQCDSTTAEEYKAQAISFAENGERAKAAEAYLKAAEKGDAESQFIVGYLYLIGDTMTNNPFEQDYKSAMAWLEKSAEKENGDALWILGMAYIDGNWLDKNIEKGISYLVSAIGDDNYMAAYFLGCILENQEGYINKPFAEKCYLLAYKKGCLTAGASLGALYLLNNDIFQDFGHGMQIYNQAVQEISALGLDPLNINSTLEYDMDNYMKHIKI